MINKIASDDILHQSYRWLCEQRKDTSYNNDVWDLRFHWQLKKHRIQQQLLQGIYRFSPIRQITIGTERISYWAAQDALVLKAITLVLTEHLSDVLSKRCFSRQKSWWIKSSGC
jgi:RNA-directed DNA polymerase